MQAADAPHGGKHIQPSHFLNSVRLLRSLDYNRHLPHNRPVHQDVMRATTTPLPCRCAALTQTDKALYPDDMVLSRRVVRGVIVGLTVCTTMLTSLPHFDCVCPNGQHKPFCLNVSSSKGCCCGGTCCIAGGNGGDCCCSARELLADTAIPTNCCHQEQPSPPVPGTPTEAKHNGCTKTLAVSTFVGIAPGESSAIAPTLTAPGWFLPTQSTIVSRSYSQTDPGRRSWPNSHPPPTDLVIDLRRFLI